MVKTENVLDRRNMSKNRVGIKDVAREAGVSITTVSRALNGYSDVNADTKERILEIVKQLHYVPDQNARSLGGISSTVMALLVSGLYERDDSGNVYATISSMHKVAEEHHCDFIILTTNSEKQNNTSYVDLCRDKAVDGVFMIGLNTSDPYYKELMNSEIPCVVAEWVQSGQNTCGVSVDNRRAAKEAVEHLLSLGHTRIAMINGKASAEVSAYRRSGYEQALREAGIEPDPSWIYDGRYLEEEAAQKTRQLLSEHPDVTGIFCASDVMAIGVIKALNAAGRSVPEDVSVVGFDDIPLAAYVNGGLTTVRQSFYEIGLRGAEALYQMITRGKEYKHIDVPYEFVVRHTTDVPRRGR